MTQISATRTARGLSLVIDGEPVTIMNDHRNFDTILEALRNKDFDAVPNLVNISKAIEEFTEGAVSIVNGIVQYKDEAISNTVTDRLIKTFELGLDPRPIARFLERLMKNPSNRSVQQLYDFMEACDLPITEDGRLLAYKSVNQDYWDTHTGCTYLNEIGAVIEMPRNKVDDDPDRTCSHGLHVCSQGYGMYGSRLLMVAVDPADVVSVPRDYNSAKMRVCKYEVLKDVQHEGFKKFDDTPIYSDDSIEWEEDDEFTDWDSYTDNCF